MARLDDRFTGGDDLVPGSMEHSVHQAMMANELNGGRGAYRISNAQLGASGPSYGPFQYDLGANARARSLFEEIARTGLGEDGQRILGDGDLDAIKRTLYQPFSRIHTDPAAQRTYEHLLPRINAALDSETGHRLINEDYQARLGLKIEAADTAIAAVANSDNRAFLQGNRLARLIMVDTANQYGDAVNDGLHRFIGMGAQSMPMDMPGRRRSPERIGINGVLGLEDMIRYKLETQYGQTNSGARDVLRRISNLADAAGLENIPLSKEDRQFLQTGLADYLRENGRAVDLDDPALAGLRGLGKRPAQQAGAIAKPVDMVDADTRRPNEMDPPVQIDAAVRNDPLLDALWKRLPPGTSRDKAEEVKLATKVGGIERIEQLDHIAYREGDSRAFVVGRIPGFRAVVDLSAPAPSLAETRANEEKHDREQALIWERFEQQQAQLDEGGPRMAIGGIKLRGPSIATPDLGQPAADSGGGGESGG